MIVDKPMSKGMGHSYWLAWVTCFPKEWVPESQGVLRVCVCVFVCVCVCVCVCVVVVVVAVRWQTLKGRNGGHLKGYLLTTGTSDTTANSHALSPQAKPKKLSLQLSKLSADCSSQF